MKTFINTFLLVCCLVLTSCNSDDTSPSVLKIISIDNQIEAKGGDTTIQIQTTSTSVKATSDVEWCQVKDATSEAIKLFVEPNKQYPGRTAQISITDGTNTQQITLIQDGATLSYNASELIQRSNNQAAQLPVELFGSFPIEANIPEKDKNWLSFEYSKDKKTGTFIVAQNSTGAPRGSLVQIKSGNRILDYQVLQYEPSHFVGNWKGEYLNKDKKYTLPNITISAPDEENKYTISGLYLTNSYNYKVKASYSNNVFLLTSGQLVGNYIAGLEIMDVYFCLIDSTNYPWWDTNYSINLEPVLLTNGSFALLFADNSSIPGTTATGISFAGFTGSPSASTSMGHIRALQNCIIYK